MFFFPPQFCVIFAMLDFFFYLQYLYNLQIKMNGMNRSKHALRGLSRTTEIYVCQFTEIKQMLVNALVIPQRREKKIFL